MENISRQNLNQRCQDIVDSLNESWKNLNRFAHDARRLERARGEIRYIGRRFMPAISTLFSAEARFLNCIQDFSQRDDLDQELVDQSWMLCDNAEDVAQEIKTRLPVFLFRGGPVYRQRLLVHGLM